MRRIYTHLGYDDYKKLGAAIATMLDRETTHTSVGDDPDNSRFYHKSYSLPIDDDLVFEFHGPDVAGIGQEKEKAFAYDECPHPFRLIQNTTLDPLDAPACRGCGEKRITR